MILQTKGYKAIEKVKIFQLDLIFLDVIMPGMDCFNVCEVLKSASETKQIPFVIISSL